MFDIEAKIVEWRQRMRAVGLQTPQTLAELESHLREDLHILRSSGKSDEVAFELAILRLGNPQPLRAEFNKLNHPRWWPVTVGYCLYTGSMIGAAIFIAVKYWLLFGAWKVGLVVNPLLLCAHVITVTAGYCAAFFAGGFGMLYICSRLFQTLPSERQRALNNAVLLFSKTSIWTVTIGFLLGMIWWKQNRGTFLAGDLKEVGAVCVVIWFMILAVTRQRRLMSERATMLMSIAGNMMVSVAWFGAGMLGHKILGFWPLALVIFLGVHILFLVMGLVPAARTES